MISSAEIVTAFFEKGINLAMVKSCSVIVTISFPKISHRMLLTIINNPNNRPEHINNDSEKFTEINGTVTTKNRINIPAIMHLKTNSNTTIFALIV
jgi:hypothetical protein